MSDNIVKEIYDGWKNYAFKKDNIETIAKQRIIICVKNNCGQFNKRKFCKECGCYMPAKVRNLKSKCRLGYW